MKYTYGLALAMVLLASVARAEGDFVSEQFGSPVHKSLTSLCSGSVMSATHDEIVWAEYASTLSASQLIDAYKAKLGTTGFKAEGEGGDWDLSGKHVTITSLKDYRPKGSCDKKPSYGSRSVVEISAFYKGSK